MARRSGYDIYRMEENWLVKILWTCSKSFNDLIMLACRASRQERRIQVMVCEKCLTEEDVMPIKTAMDDGSTWVCVSRNYVMCRKYVSLQLVSIPRSISYRLMGCSSRQLLKVGQSRAEPR